MTRLKRYHIHTPHVLQIWWQRWDDSLVTAPWVVLIRNQARISKGTLYIFYNMMSAIYTTANTSHTGQSSGIPISHGSMSTTSTGTHTYSVYSRPISSSGICTTNSTGTGYSSIEVGSSRAPTNPGAYDSHERVTHQPTEGRYSDDVNTEAPHVICSSTSQPSHDYVVHPQCCTRAHKKAMPYDGKSSCEDYLIQFALLSKLNGWNMLTKALELATSLEGAARSVLADMEPHDRLTTS